MSDSEKNIQSNENEFLTVDLKTLFFRVLSHWRSILLWALIFAAAFAALRSLTGGKTEKNGEQRTQELQRIYQEASDQLAAQNSQETQLFALRDYQQNSLYMQIDPREKHVRETIFAIRLDKDGMLNSLDMLAGAYVFGLNLAPVAEELGVDYRYAEELVRWGIVDAREETDASDGIRFSGFWTAAVSSDDTRFAGLWISVIGESDELTARITDVLQREIEGMERTLSANVAEHTIAPISQRVYTRIDDELLQVQTDLQQQVIMQQKTVDDLETGFQEYVRTLTRELQLSEGDTRRLSFLTPQEQMEMLSEKLETPVNDAVEGISITRIVKNFIIGCIIGGILMAGGWAAVCVFGRRFEAADEFFTRYGVTRLGVFAPDERELGLRKTKLDRAILTCTGDYTGMDEEKTTELAAATIGNLMGERKRLLVTGTASAEKIQALGRKLAALMPEREIITAPDFLGDAQTIRDLPELDAVVLTEERRSSFYGRIDRELNFLNRLGKEMLGAFIV